MTSFYRRVGKRSLDVLLSAVALVVLAPLIAAIAVVVRLRLGAPVLFRQQRPGLGGRPFELAKFRSMRNAVGPDGQPLSDSERATPLGRRLRGSSLDELPTLWNVLRGDMSMVGPRPLLMQYLPLYSKLQSRRHEVPPGITGWAQVNGRNTLTWEEKFALDVWYVDNLSLGIDVKIIARTIAKVIVREGVDFAEPESMPFFSGSGDSQQMPALSEHGGSDAILGGRPDSQIGRE